MRNNQPFSKIFVAALIALASPAAMADVGSPCMTDPQCAAAAPVNGATKCNTVTSKCEVPGGGPAGRPGGGAIAPAGGGACVPKCCAPDFDPTACARNMQSIADAQTAESTRTAKLDWFRQNVVSRWEGDEVQNREIRKAVAAVTFGGAAASKDDLPKFSVDQLVTLAETLEDVVLFDGSFRYWPQAKRDAHQALTQERALAGRTGASEDDKIGYLEAAAERLGWGKYRQADTRRARRARRAGRRTSRSSRAGACSDAAPCAAPDQTCVRGKCVSLKECTSDAQCGSNETCEAIAGTGRCVKADECTQNEDCVGLSYCKAGTPNRCVRGCYKDEQCGSGKTCDTSTHQCKADTSSYSPRRSRPARRARPSLRSRWRQAAPAALAHGSRLLRRRPPLPIFGR